MDKTKTCKCKHERSGFRIDGRMLRQINSGGIYRGSARGWQAPADMIDYHAKLGDVDGVCICDSATGKRYAAPLSVFVEHATLRGRWYDLPLAYWSLGEAPLMASYEQLSLFGAQP